MTTPTPSLVETTILQLQRDLAAAQERIRKSEADISAMTAHAKQQAERAQAAEAWREAVINELIVAHIYTKEHDANPRKALQDAITWNCQVALDPRVSSDARKLIEGSEARAEASERDAERWNVCLDAQGVAVSIFNVDPPCWRYPEGDQLVAAIDAIRTGADGAWSVPIDDGSRPALSLTAQSRDAIEARFYRYLRDEAGQYAEDTDGPMICAGLGDQFDYLRGEECDEAIRAAIEAKAAIAEGKR